MKILIIVDDYMPYSIKVGGKMMHELSREFISKGHEVSVIVPNPNIKKPYELSSLDNVEIIYFRTGEIKNVSKYKRALNESVLSLRAWRSLKDILINNPHDLIVYYSPSIFWGGLVKKLKSIWNCKSYLILRDFFPQWIIDNGIISENSPQAYFFKYFERINYNSANCIALQSPKNLNWFRNYIKVDCKLDIIYNWSKMLKTPSLGIYRRKLKLENKVVFFYGGNIGKAQDMMNLIRFAKNMQRFGRAHFVFVGEGDEVNLIRRYINNNDMKNTTLLPSVDQQEFVKMLSEFDIGLFSLHPNHKTHNFPGKLLAYMAQSIPILGSVNLGNDLKETIEDYDAGFISINGDDNAFFKNGIKLFKDQKLRKSMGKRGKYLLNNVFSVDSATEKILAFCDETKKLLN